MSYPLFNVSIVECDMAIEGVEAYDAESAALIAVERIDREGGDFWCARGTKMTVHVWEAVGEERYSEQMTFTVSCEMQPVYSARKE